MLHKRADRVYPHLDIFLFPRRNSDALFADGIITVAHGVDLIIDKPQQRINLRETGDGILCRSNTNEARGSSVSSHGKFS